jgi:ribose-phosphate pyrophosphokinase
MLILNLANPNFQDLKSIKFKISSFPDGQQSIQILESPSISYQDFSIIRKVQIKSRLNSFKDLEVIIGATHALRELGVENIDLYIPYCLGGRSDRKFSEGGFNYIKKVVAPIINLQKFHQVEIMDPHSDVLEACIDRFKKIDNSQVVRFAFDDYFDNLESHEDFTYVRLVSPDAGALKKVFHISEEFGIKQEIIIAAKHRDPVSGQITHTSVPLSVNDADKDLFIIDDICDGGRTFVEIAKAIQKTRSLSSAVHPSRYGKIFLIVTHGIFSAGFEELGEYLDGIYCTNSIKDIVEGTVGTSKSMKPINFNQLNVF